TTHSRRAPDYRRLSSKRREPMIQPLLRNRGAPMSDLPPQRTLDTPNPSPEANEARHAQIRAEAISLLIGGALCLYFGFTLPLNAPANVPDDVAEKWFMADRVCYYVLRGVGCGFLLAAALAAAGIRISLLLSVATELIFALLMIAMTVIWTWRAQVSGGF